MKIFNKKSEEEKVEEEIISMVNEGNERTLRPSLLQTYLSSLTRRAEM